MKFIKQASLILSLNKSWNQKFVNINTKDLLTLLSILYSSARLSKKPSINSKKTTVINEIIKYEKKYKIFLQSYLYLQYLIS